MDKCAGNRLEVNTMNRVYEMHKLYTMYKVNTMYKIYTIYRVYSLYFSQYWTSVIKPNMASGSSPQVFAFEIFELIYCL